jgi:hypothetical protein
MATLAGELDVLKPLYVGDLIRVGNINDGGYVLPESALHDIDALVSFGVCDDWSLEEDLTTRFPDMLVHAYDHTIGVSWFRRSAVLGLAKFLLRKSSLKETLARFRTLRNYQEFFSAERPHFAERIFDQALTASDATIDRVFSRLPGKSKLLLKVDIEGCEYRVIPQILSYADRISIMAVEFHDTAPYRSIFLQQIAAMQQHFSIVHIHGNNFGGIATDGLPEVLEITFLNNRDIEGDTHRTHFPVAGVDYPNDPTRDDIVMVFAE